MQSQPIAASSIARLQGNRRAANFNVPLRQRVHPSARRLMHSAMRARAPLLYALFFLALALQAMRFANIGAGKWAC